MIASFALLSDGLTSTPVGTGYTVWPSSGAAGTALMVMSFLGEPRTALRILCILLIRAGALRL